MNRLTESERKADIVSAAVALANEKGLISLSLKDVAENCVADTTARTVRYYFSLKSLRKAVAGDDRLNVEAKNEAVALGIA